MGTAVFIVAISEREKDRERACFVSISGWIGVRHSLGRIESSSRATQFRPPVKQCSAAG